MAGKSPTQRTLEFIRSHHYQAGIVERWIAQAGPHGMRKDLFDIIDLIAIKRGHIIGIQSCGLAFSDHNAKILESKNSIAWLLSGAELWLVGWRKVKAKRGGKQMIWSPRVKQYTLEDFDTADIKRVLEAQDGSDHVETT